MILNEATEAISKIVMSGGLPALNQRLAELHHPYQLLLQSAPYGGYRAGPLELSSLSMSVDSSSDTKPGNTGKLLRDLSSAGSSALLLSGNTPGAFLSSTASVLSSCEEKGDGLHTSVSSALCSLGSSANADLASAQTLAHSFVLDSPILHALVLTNSWHKRGINGSTRMRDSVEVTSDRIRSGSTVARAFRYSGSDTQIVTNGIQYEIGHNDPFLQLHVNQDVRALSKMSPVDRIRKIKADFLRLCSILNDPEDHDLTSEQIGIVESLNHAPLIGISHLARLVTSRGVATWGIDELPLALRMFHAIDSRLVARAFGGTRKITPEDISVLFLPAEQRQRICS